MGVVRQLSQEMVFRLPKSRAGNRSMYADDDTAEYLKRGKNFKNNNLLQMA